MKIIKTENKTSHAEYINLQGYENNKAIFACDATIERKNKNGWTSNKPIWTKWTISFGSCNGEIDFMVKRVAVINKALQLANKLNK